MRNWAVVVEVQRKGRNTAVWKKAVERMVNGSVDGGLRG